MTQTGTWAKAPTKTLKGFARQIGLALVGSGAARAWASPTVCAVAVAIAAAPFAGWKTPALWLAAMLALIAGEAFSPRSKAQSGESPPLNAFAWLSTAGFAAAAFYLVFRFTGAAQTLGVTLYGVVMFQILARDYASPRRLIINLLPLIAAVVVVQGLAGTLLLVTGHPWRLITLVASPYIVFRTFHALRENLDRARRIEAEGRKRMAVSAARYRLLAEHSPDLIMRYDLAGRMEYVSPAARLYGAEPEWFVGRNVRDFLEPADWARNDAFLAALARGEPLPQGHENVWRGMTPAGRPVLFEGATSPITDPSGAAIGAVVILRDITAKQALEDELRRKTADAEAATQAKSQFLANMSHEIRTPLTGVIGFARLLNSLENLPEEARRHAVRIKDSADALLSVVNDILDFSKLEAGGVAIDRQPADPRALIEGAADLVRERAAEKGLSVIVEDQVGLPDRLMLDVPHLRQVLLNLLVNAVKFTETGEIRVRPAYDAGRAQLSIAVEDTGIGIAPDVAGRLFQRFSQVDGSNTRRHGGSGLGLAICKALVELMGGQIGLESAPSVGSTFRFSVCAPVAEGEVERLPEPSEAVEIGAVRLLVVDDVQANRELVKAILSPLAVEVVEAASGPAAIEAALAEAFDVILMDLQMPGMDGMTASAAIRKGSGLNRRTPILALSANVLPEHVAASQAAGMDDHIGKPIDPAELLGKIAHWTSLAAAASEDVAQSA